MAYVNLGADRYAFSVYIPPGESPTGHPIRVRIRRRCPANRVKALDAEITHAVATLGAWSPETSEVLGALAGQGGGIPPKRPKTTGTLGDALAIAWDDSEEGWKNARTGRLLYANARDVVKIIGAHRPCSSITREDYATVREEFAKKQLVEATVLRKLQCFYRVLKFAEDKGWIKARPKFKRRKLSNARRFTFTPDMEAACILHFRNYPYSARSGLYGMDEVFIAGIDGGFRASEIVNMLGSNVNLSASLVLVPDQQSKNGEFRQVFITDRLAEILARRIKQHGKGLLFPEWSLDALGYQMREARRKLDPGNKEFVFHATRHTHITRWAERGLELAALMDQAGHKTPSITMRYIHMTVEKRKAQMREALARSGA